MSYQLNTILPDTQEGQVIAQTISASASTTVIRFSGIAGSRLSVFAKSTQADTVRIRHYAANRKLEVDNDTVLVSDTDTRVEDEGAMGQEIHIIIVNAGVESTVTCWACIRP